MKSALGSWSKREKLIYVLKIKELLLIDKQVFSSRLDNNWLTYQTQKNKKKFI